VRTLLFAAIVAMVSVPGFAQATNSTSAQLVQTPRTTAGEATLATPAGHEVNAGISGYNYVEPGSLKISIHGAKLSGEYTGTVPLNLWRRWFVKANARASIGRASYDGWCAPWLITPDSRSPNGYLLDVGEYTPCDDVGNKDWYLEARGLIGRDFIFGSWAWSPEVGVGVRHLSNGISGINGFRTDNYLYVPIGITARTHVGSRVLSFNVESDLLVHGWQTTRHSLLGDGVVPATPTAPEFTIDGFSDVSFDQRGGWAVRASARYPIYRRLLLEPYVLYWRVADSDVSVETATFTVNGVPAREQLTFLEPMNTTREVGVKLGLRF